MNHKVQQQRVRSAHKVGLYSFVFLGRVSVITVLLLFVSFLIQPFHQALANESLPEEPAAEPAVADEVRIEKPASAATPEPKESVAENDNNDSFDSAETENDSVSDTNDTNQPELPTNTNISNSSVKPASAKSSSTELTAAVIVSDKSSPIVSAGTGPPASTTELAKSTSTSDIGTDEFMVSDDTNTDVEQGLNDESSTASGSGTYDDEPDDELSTLVSANETDNVDTEVQVEELGDTESDEEEVPFSNTFTTDTTSDEDSVAPDETATNTAPVVVQAQSLVTDDNYYQFSKQSCVAVGDGTYHCSMKSGLDSDLDAAVYAEQDVDGDMEIYLRTSKGEIKKLSDNLLDDTSPHFDAESMRVVWQRQIDDRYQIISYDLTEQVETQLTFSRTNNMEPKVSIEGIVWQAWDSHDWEVMFFDGTYTDQITDNEIQDVTPVIKDGYILWSILGGEKQEARVYSLDSKETMTITGNEGGSIVNPRFVLVYDTKFENGDIITQGFDPATGLSSIIAAVPASEPVNIPEVDTTGEIRALIQNKSSQKEDTGPDGVKTPTTGNGDSLDLGIISTSTASSSDTLNLKSPTMDIASVVQATTTQAQFELTDYDLVITKTATSTGGVAVINSASTSIPVTNASSTKQ